MKPIDQLSDDEFAAVVREATALRDAPDALVRAAVALWPAPGIATVVGEAAARFAKRVRGVLSFDSWTIAPEALAVRSMPSDTRHLLFSAEGRDIDLRIGPSSAGFRITGQILGPDDAGTIELRVADDAESGPARYAAPLDELGEFRLDGVVAGRYQATLHLVDAVVELPSVDVGDRMA